MNSSREVELFGAQYDILKKKDDCCYWSGNVSNKGIGDIQLLLFLLFLLLLFSLMEEIIILNIIMLLVVILEDLMDNILKEIKPILFSIIKIKKLIIKLLLIL